MVVVADLQADKGEALAEEIGGVFAQVDVTQTDQITAAVKAAAEIAPLRAVVNCAGIGWAQRTIGRDGQIESAHDLDAFTKVVEINLIGTFDCSAWPPRAMSRNEPDADGQRGAIVNLASVAAFDGQIGQASYSASKGGVVGMTLPVARDLSASGIRLNTVAPGLIDTPIYGEGPDSEAFKANLGESVLFPKRLGVRRRARQHGDRVPHQLLHERRGHPRRRRHPDAPEVGRPRSLGQPAPLLLGERRHRRGRVGQLAVRCRRILPDDISIASRALPRRVGHRVGRRDAEPDADLDGVLVGAHVEELPAVVLGLQLDERLDRRAVPLVAGVLEAVGHDRDDDVAGPLVLGDRGELGARVGDHPAHRVLQGRHVARPQVERRDVGDGPVGVDHLVDVVELGQVGQALAGARRCSSTNAGSRPRYRT